MSDDLNVLKELGAQKIHKDTHISKEHMQAILHETFDGLNSVQFIGFISILEREYSIDLSELRAKGIAYFDDISAKSTDTHNVFVVPKRKQNNTRLFVLLVILIFVSFVYYTFNYLNSITPDIEKIDNTKIVNAQKSMKPILEIKQHGSVSDINETNTSVVDIVASEPKAVAKIEKIVEKEKTLKLLPKNKVWLGYINMDSNQKYQKIFTQEFALDVTKNWLLLFGAGNIKLEVNGETKKFASKKNMRFKYVDGELIKINVEEFKALNKGRKW